jgi:hypothetical protein
MAGTALAVLVLAACGSSGGSTSSGTTTSTGYGLNSLQSYAYDACQQAAFAGGPGAMRPGHAANIEWRDLNSADVTVTGSGTQYTVSATVEFDNDLGAKVSQDVTCPVTRRPGNRWSATGVTLANWHQVVPST